MLKLFTFLFFLISSTNFSQAQTKDYIHWISLEKAQEYSKKYKNKDIDICLQNCLKVYLAAQRPKIPQDFDCAG